MAVTIPDFSKRAEYLDFIGVIDSATDAVTWYSIGTGFDTANYSPGAQTLSTQFVNETAQSTITTSYLPTVDLSAYVIKNNDLIKKLMEIGYYQKTGADAIVHFRRVLTIWPGAAADTYEAFQQLMNVAIDSDSPDNGLNKISGTLSYFSSFEKGTYNASTDEFTAAA